VSDPPVVATGGVHLAATEGGDSACRRWHLHRSRWPEPLATTTPPSTGRRRQHSRDDCRERGWLVHRAGHHTYAEEGAYTLAVTLAHDTAAPVTVGGTATVSDPSVVATGGVHLLATEGSDSGLQTVATFTDPGGPKPVSDYNATINWGTASAAPRPSWPTRRLLRRGVVTPMPRRARTR